MIDLKVLEGTFDDLAGEPARERIFDVMMRRIDALTPYKAALRRMTAGPTIRPAGVGSPQPGRGSTPSASCSRRPVFRPRAVSGTLKLQGAVLVFGNTMRTWLRR